MLIPTASKKHHKNTSPRTSSRYMRMESDLALQLRRGLAMELAQSIESRMSVRGFTAEDVPEELVNEALRLAVLAPSAGNLQARDFVVVRDPLVKDKIAEAAFDLDFLRQAPVVVVCCANLARIRNYGDRGATLYCLQDVAAAVEHILLFAASQGLGACWIGAFDEAEVSKALSLPARARPVTIIPIGRPKTQARRTKRLEMDEVVHRERW
jgi:nitroreductase